MKIFYVNEIKKLLIIISCIGLLIFSCDDREPEDPDTANYVISVESHPVAGGINGDIVGEDVVGATVATRIETKLSGENDKPIKNALISFSAKVENEDYGGFDLSSGRTGDDGTITVLYIDDGSAGAVDNSTSVNKWEGVIVKAEFSDNVDPDTTRFNVYASQNQVWPYHITLSSDSDEIILGDGGSTLTVELKNKLDKPVRNVSVTLITDKGTVNSAGEAEFTYDTGSDGILSFPFNDQGEQSDLGTATIIASYEHPGFNNATVYDTIQVTIRTDYTLSLESYPVAFDENDNWVRVGEDVAGDYASTRIIATLTNASGNPVVGQTLIFNAESLGEEVGEIDLPSPSQTNSQGKIYAYFDDGGTVYQDIAATPDNEGVFVTAYIGVEGGDNQEIDFSVYPTTIWPYRLSLTTDTLEIALDGGVTFANITGSLLNQLNNPVSNVMLSFDTDRGYIDPESSTSSSGGVSLEFRDTGSQQEVGTAQIFASFNHLGFDSTVTDTVEVAIVTNYILTLESYPV
ncbi:MAG: hypothetical protein VYC00_01865, partial [Candidatus Neomarinimicrobiota bacterium]|nr:hypothetical protein [Candidatus Neomarinimicrobiota bacterium]